MRNSIAFGWRVAVRTTLLQLGATAVAALCATGWGASAALAVLIGGIIIASGYWLAARRAFGRRVVAPTAALGAIVLGQVIKWVWIGVTLVVTIGSGLFPPLAVLIGVAVALVSQLGGLLFEH